MNARIHPSWAPLPLALTLLAVASCGEGPESEPSPPAEAPPAEDPGPSSVADLLREGHVVFGIFSGDHTREQGAELVRTTDPDFVFYSLETGPFDMDAMAAYMAGMREGAGAGGPPPVALRIPPIREGRDEAREHARLGLENGARGLVFPHVENGEEALLAVELTGPDVWPAAPGGEGFNVLLIEDQGGVGRAREIVTTPGVSVVIPGPGDLGRAYEGDAEAVENAIQTVLAACLEAGVPCGITAGVDDIAERIEQGFLFFIVTEAAALEVGKRAAGRG